MKHQIELQNLDPAGLAGVGDGNLKILEGSFDCQIVLRGSTISLQGDESIVVLATETIREMMKILGRKNRLTTDEVSSLAVMVSNGEKVDDPTDEPVILHTHKGPITPRSEGQKRFCEAVQEDDMVFAIGPAGTGKTFLAVTFAVAAQKSRRVERIILSRPAVEAGERLGFLPGDLKEKIDPYLTPLYDALNDLLPEENLKSKWFLLLT